MSISIFGTSLSDDATVATASNELSGLTVSNLQKPQPSDVWRSDGLSNLVFEFNLGSAKSIDYAFLGYTNATDSATWQIKADTSQANVQGGSPAFDTGSVQLPIETGLTRDTIHGLEIFSSAQSFQWWRVEISDSGNSDGFFQAGRFHLGDKTTLPKGINFGWSIAPFTGTIKRRAFGGQLYPLQSWLARRIGLELDFLTESQMLSTMYEFVRARSDSNDLIFSIDPDSSTAPEVKLVYGVLSRLRPIQNNTIGFYRLKLEIEEML